MNYIQAVRKHVILKAVTASAPVRGSVPVREVLDVAVALDANLGMHDAVLAAISLNAHSQHDLLQPLLQRQQLRLLKEHACSVAAMQSIVPYLQVAGEDQRVELEKRRELLVTDPLARVQVSTT